MSDLRSPEERKFSSQNLFMYCLFFLLTYMQALYIFTALKVPYFVCVFYACVILLLLGTFFVRIRKLYISILKSYFSATELCGQNRCMLFLHLHGVYYIVMITCTFLTFLCICWNGDPPPVKVVICLGSLM